MSGDSSISLTVAKGTVMSDVQAIKDINAKGAAEKSGTSTPKVVWDDTNMKTSYANVVNASSTREEITVFFGTNQTWNVSKDKEFVVQLSDRIVLNPFAAKRLWTLMGAMLNEYETRYGQLDLKDTARKTG
jgi:hypothetical protein